MTSQGHLGSSNVSFCREGRWGEIQYLLHLPCPRQGPAGPNWLLPANPNTSTRCHHPSKDVTKTCSAGKWGRISPAAALQDSRMRGLRELSGIFGTSWCSKPPATINAFGSCPPPLPAPLSGGPGGLCGAGAASSSGGSGLLPAGHALGRLCSILLWLCFGYKSLPPPVTVTAPASSGWTGLAAGRLEPCLGPGAVLQSCVPCLCNPPLRGHPPHSPRQIQTLWRGPGTPRSSPALEYLAAGLP